MAPVSLRKTIDDCGSTRNSGPLLSLMRQWPGRLTLNRRKISVKKAMISGVLLETWGSLDDNDDAGEICNEDDDDGGSDSNDDESGLLFGVWQ